MMNGTPKKHSFSSSEENRRGDGGWATMESKDKMGGWVYIDMHGEYIILFQSTKVPCDEVWRGMQAVSRDASMATS